MKRAWILSLWLVAAPTALAAGVEFEGRLWSPDLSGTVQVGSAGGAAAGSVIDLGTELGIGDDEVGEGRLIWRPTKRTSVRLGFASFSFAGQNVIERNIDFSGTSFLVSSDVASVLNLDYGRVGIAWQFLSSPDGRIRFGPLVEAKGFRGDASLSTNVGGILPLAASERFEVAFGAAGLVLDVEPSRKLHLFAEWTTLVGSDEGDLTDAEAGLRYYPLDILAITVGYRTIEIDAEDRNDLLRLDLDGPWFGAVLRF